jgi:hypothetical protein
MQNRRMQNSGNSDIPLNVNDRDTYEDVSRMRENMEEQQEEKRQFRR